MGFASPVVPWLIVTVCQCHALWLFVHQNPRCINKHSVRVCVGVGTVRLLTISLSLICLSVCLSVCLSISLATLSVLSHVNAGGCSGKAGKQAAPAPALSQLAGCVHQRLRRLLEAGISQVAFDLLTKAWNTHTISATVAASAFAQHYNPLVETRPHRRRCCWPWHEPLPQGLKPGNNAKAFLSRCIVAIECWFLLFR